MTDDFWSDGYFEPWPISPNLTMVSLSRIEEAQRQSPSSECLGPYLPADIEWCLRSFDLLEAERAFHAHEDRNMRDCRVYGYLLTGDLDSDVGGAMYEVGEMEVVSWLWYEAFELDYHRDAYPSRSYRANWVDS